MPSKLPRVNLTVPFDLMEMLSRDAESEHIPLSSRVLQILYKHFESRKKEAQIFTEPELLESERRKAPVFETKHLQATERTLAPREHRNQDQS